MKLTSPKCAKGDNDMKEYTKPVAERLELSADEDLAAIIRSEPTVEDDDLSV